jgi:hypothetical protein
VAIVSGTVAFVILYFFRAAGGAVVFLALGIFFFVAIFRTRNEPLDGSREPPPAQPSITHTHTAVSTTGAGAMYWLVYSGRPEGAVIIVLLATAWLASVLYEAAKARKRRHEETSTT